jgi:SIR2-like domain
LEPPANPARFTTAFDPLPYYKLHGTIDHLHDRSAPLILTQESYLDPKRNRGRLFGRLRDLASEFPIVFVGTKVADLHIREIIADVDGAAGTRPNYYFVAPGLTSFDEQLLGARRMTPINMTFEAFMAALDQDIAPLARRLSPALGRATHSIERHFRRHASVSPSLRAFLTDNVEHVHGAIASTTLSPQLFFKGESGSWDPIERGYDFERHIHTAVMLRLLGVEYNEHAIHAFVVRGVAGAGKSVFGRRIAYDLASKHEQLVLYAPAGAHLRADPLLDLHDLTGLPVTIVVDQAADQIRALEELASRLEAAKVPVSFLLLDTAAAFGSSLDDLSQHLRGHFELRNLTRNEIEALLAKLEVHSSLGMLQPMSAEQRIATFEELADRQLLVALYEATQGKPLEQLLVDEYDRILLSEAQELYLLVCTLNRFDVPVRAGLVSRVMGVRFNDFEKRFLGPLDGLVFAQIDPQSRDYAYRARHSQIAEIVFRRVLDTQTKQSEQYARVLEGINPSYASDNAAMRKLLAFRNLRDLSFSLAERRRILKLAEREIGPEPFILQQRAILEMNTSGGDLSVAEECLDAAILAHPRDYSLKHTKASLLARKASKIDNPIARKAERNKARNALAEIRSDGATDPYTLALKAALSIDELRDLMSSMPKSDDTLADPSMVRLVEDAERALATGLAAQPDFEALTRESFRLHKLMGETAKGLSLLKRTIEKQPHLEYLTVTYARAVAPSNLPEALRAVRRCLDEKPNARLLNQCLFELMIVEADDHRDALLGPLRRAFTVGDGNLPIHVQAIRFHFMRNEKAELQQIVAGVAAMRLPYHERDRPRFPAIGSGEDGTFNGRIVKLMGNYGFVEVQGMAESVFLSAEHSAGDCWDDLRSGMMIRFNLHFNGRGAIGVNVVSQS